MSTQCTTVPLTSGIGSPPSTNRRESVLFEGNQQTPSLAETIGDVCYAFFTRDTPSLKEQKTTCDELYKIYQSTRPKTLSPNQPFTLGLPRELSRELLESVERISLVNLFPVNLSQDSSQKDMETFLSKKGERAVNVFADQTTCFSRTFVNSTTQAFGLTQNTPQQLQASYETLLETKHTIACIPRQLFLVQDQVVSIVIQKRGLRVIPRYIDRFPKLETLDISGNKVFSLPPSLLSLSALRKVVVIDNPLTNDEESMKILETLSQRGVCIIKERASSFSREAKEASQKASPFLW